MTTQTRYPSIDAFYADRGGERSGESDFGCWWTARGGLSRGPFFRVSVVHETGDLYAINLTTGEVELLGSWGADPNCTGRLGLRHTEACAYSVADRVLDGWAYREKSGMSLAWVRERIP